MNITELNEFCILHAMHIKVCRGKLKGIMIGR